MKTQLSCCGRGWTHWAVFLVFAIAVIVNETWSHPAAVVGPVPHRSKEPLVASQALPPQPRVPRRVARPIARPAECVHDTIFTDCFLCGKISEEIGVYRQCCHRDAEIVDFCTLLLT